MNIESDLTVLSQQELLKIGSENLSAEEVFGYLQADLKLRTFSEILQ